MPCMILWHIDPKVTLALQLLKTVGVSAGNEGIKLGWNTTDREVDLRLQRLDLIGDLLIYLADLCSITLDL